MERCEPSLTSLISYHRHDENIPCASGGYVEEPHRLLSLTLTLFLRVLAQLRRAATGGALNEQTT